jgi:hypothetical protein
MPLGRLALAVMSLAGLGLGVAQARPLTPAENHFQPYSGLLPPCDIPWALKNIQDRFRDREREYWNSGLEIVGFGPVSEIGFRSNGLDYVPRRYCIAEVIMSDQHPREVSFSIGEGTAGIGFRDGIDFCVSGLDRNDAYAPNCKMARP